MVVLFNFEKLTVLYDLIIEHLAPETLSCWFNCFSTPVEDQDPRRMWFYINYFKNLIFRKFNDQTTSSFQNSSCLNLLRPMNQFEWRIPNAWPDMYELFRDKMDHPYKVVRDKITRYLLVAKYS